MGSIVPKIYLSAFLHSLMQTLAAEAIGLGQYPQPRSRLITMLIHIDPRFHPVISKLEDRREEQSCPGGFLRAEYAGLYV